MNKQTLLLLTLLGTQVTAKTQGLEWAGNYWAPEFSFYEEEPVSHVDASGNIYTAKYVLNSDGPVDLDPGPGSVLLSTITHGIYLQKLNTDGLLSWAKMLLQAGNNAGHDVVITAVDADQYGYIYTTGYFKGTYDFDPGPNKFNLTSLSTQSSIFVQKLDANGNLVWAERMGGNIFKDDIAYDVETDAFGGVIITGFFSETVDFDPGPGVMNLTCKGAYNAFILKLKPDGSLDWVRQIRNPDYPSSNVVDFSLGRFLSIDQGANVYVAGNFSGKTDFEPGPDSLLLTPDKTPSSYILKLNSQGGLIWVQGLGPLEFYSLTNDAKGNLICSGIVGDTTDFDPGPDTLAQTGGGFVLKWTADGTLGWLKGVYHLEAVDVTPGGNVSILEVLSPTTDINPSNDCFLTFINYNNSLRLFLRTFDQDGQCLWGRKFDVHSSGGPGFIGIDANENIYLRARFTGTVDFDPDPANIALLSTTYPNKSDMFVGKLRQQLSIRGTLFYDPNDNLMQDAGEPGIPGEVLQVRHRDMYLSTDTAGHFRSYANIGKDTLNPALKSPFWSASPEYHIPGFAPAELDFAVSIPAGLKDIAVEAVQATPFLRGFNTDIWLLVTNLGDQMTNSFTLNFQVTTQPVPVPLEMGLIDPLPASQTSDQLSWLLPGLGLFETRKILVRMYTPVLAQNGSPIGLSAQVVLANDADLTNNSAAIKAIVTGSFDPNDKQVFPERILPEQLDSTRLQYLIRFQNTGNAPAQFVIIRDTLPAGLDIASLQMIGASHAYTWRLYGPGILEVRFDMIHLPDSSVNEAGSHGFVVFSVRPRRNLLEGDTIGNRAGIYFDYNAPIITRPAVVRIGETSGTAGNDPVAQIDFSLSPNPVAGYAPVMVIFPESLRLNTNLTITMIDLNDRIVHEKIRPPHGGSIAMPGLAPGVYVVQARTGNSTRSKLLIVK